MHTVSMVPSGRKDSDEQSLIRELVELTTRSGPTGPARS